MAHGVLGKEQDMKFSLKIWKFEIVVNLIDIDPSDKKIAAGISVSWK